MAVAVGGDIALPTDSTGGTITGAITITGGTSPMLSVQNSGPYGSNTVIIGDTVSTLSWVFGNDGSFVQTQKSPAAVSSGNGTNATANTVTAATGGNSSDTTNGTIAGLGAVITLQTGPGGNETAASGNVTGGAGGNLTLKARNGGTANATSGTGVGGAGGTVAIASGNGGAGTTTGGVGANITITAGNAGSGGNAAGGSVINIAGNPTGTGAAGQVINRVSTNSTAAVLIQGASSTTFATFDSTNSRLRIGDATAPTQTLDVAGNFTVAGATGNTVISGTLGVTGLSTLTGGFTSSAASTIVGANTFTVRTIDSGGGSAAWSNVTTMRFNSNDLELRGAPGSGGFLIGFNGASQSGDGITVYNDNFTTVKLVVDPGVGTTGTVILTSKTSAGANTAFTFTEANAATTLLSVTSSDSTGTFTLPGAAPASVAGNGTAAPNGTIKGTNGGASSGTTGQSGGTGSSWTVTSGTGGAVAGASGIGGAGGGFTVTAGNGGNGAATGGGGGSITITAGNAGTGGNAAGGSITITAGAATGSGGAGTIINQVSTNSTSAYVFQNAASSNFMILDSTNKRMRIGDAVVPTQTLDIAGTFTVAGATGNTVIGSSGPTLSKSATSAALSVRNATTTLADINLNVLGAAPGTLQDGDFWVTDIAGTRRLNVRIAGVTYSITVT